MKSEVRSAPHPLTLAGLPLPRLGSRELFPGLSCDVYLAHAAISPACSLVERVTSECMGTVAELGVASFPIYSEQRERLRGSLATLLKVPASNLALSAGCTRGITDLALALPWKAGDLLLTFEGEFPANVIPWQLAARTHGADVAFLPLPSSRDPNCIGETLETLRRAFDAASERRVRIPWVAVSAVQFQSGLRMPLLEISQICREKGARLFVDGIQACGVVPLDLKALGVDAFFGGAHKWLLGLEGAGYSYFSDELMEQLRPLTAGWLSYENGDHFLFRGKDHLRYDRPLLNDARVFEGSTANSLGFVALEVGVELSQHLTVEAIFRHVQSYHDAVEACFTDTGFVSLRPINPELRSGILSFVPPSGILAPDLAAELKKRGVVVSLPDGMIRLSPHFANNLEEVALVGRALEGALAALQK